MDGSNNSPEISRRQFLRKGVKLAKVSAAVAVVGGPVGLVGKVVKDAVDQRSAPTEEKFAKYGLEDFLPFHLSAKELMKTYRRLPTFAEYKFGSADPQNILERLDNGGSLDEVSLRNIREGWGTSIDQAQELAQKKVEGVRIEIE